MPTVPTPVRHLLDSIAESHSEIRIVHGQYIDGVVSSKGRLKWIRIQRNHDELLLKLPKPVGYTLARVLQPGQLLQVWVRPKKDYLQALLVMPSSLVEVGDTPVQLLQMAREECTRSSSAAPTCTLRVCTKGRCQKQGAHDVVRALKQAIEEQHLEHVSVEATGCLKNCKHGPNVQISPGKALHSDVQVDDVPRLMHQLQARGR